MIEEIHPAGLVAVWVALVCYSLALTGLTIRRWEAARYLWFSGSLVFLAHALIAMGSSYGWSHDVAIAATAADTAELTGVHSGSGLWLNYLFVLVWLADGIFWMRYGSSRYLQRSWRAHALVHGFLVFMVVNGAIVFVDGAQRIAGVALVGLPAIALVFGRTLRR